MRIFVDADACPVKEIVVSCAKNLSLEVTMVVDTSHVINDGYSTVVTVDKGADSADIALINMVKRGDVVVTQDYGVAAMALGKGAKAINQNGMVYDDSNIDSLLLARHIGKKIRRSGGKTNSVPKRTHEDDKKFEESFINLISST
jgi:hypothetical protein